MKDVKMPTSRSYREYLLSSLKDPERAAGNIEVALELEEKDPQPDVLRLTLKDVIEAREQMNNLSEEAKRSYEKLDKILLETGGGEIYGLVELLDALGFRIAIAQSSEEQKHYHLEILFDGTQITLEELKKKASQALQEYLSDIELKVDSTNSAALNLAIKGTLEVVNACHKKINEILIEQSHLRAMRLLDEAGDEIRQRAYPILAEIEQRFRLFVSQALIEVCGFYWWNNLAPANIRDNVRKVQNESDGTFLDFLECTQFNDLIEIITQEVSEWTETKRLSVTDIQELRSNCKSLADFDNKLEEKTKKFSFWNNVFSRYFQDRRQWEQIKKSIKDIVITERHKVMHHRPISLSAITDLLNKKREIFTLLDSAKAKLSEQECIEVRQDIEDNIEDIRDTISAQMRALWQDLGLPKSYSELQAQTQANIKSLVRDLDLPKSYSQLQEQVKTQTEPLRREQQRQQSERDQWRKRTEPWTQQNLNLSTSEAQASETNLEQVTDQETDFNSDTNDSDENS
jgi:DNA-binding phage protein